MCDRNKYRLLAWPLAVGFGFIVGAVLITIYVVPDRID
jgi:hypothetical protein